jgi:signal transduction histidine kinase
MTGARTTTALTATLGLAAASWVAADPGARGNEFAELGDTLNGLFGRLEASFESQRRFVANASHELRTPLSAGRALLQVALADPDATMDTLRAACQEVLALGDQQERLIEALLTLATSQRGLERSEPLDLAGITRKVLLSRQHEAGRQGIQVAAALSPAPATGDRRPEPERKPGSEPGRQRYPAQPARRPGRDLNRAGRRRRRPVRAQHGAGNPAG